MAKKVDFVLGTNRHNVTADQVSHLSHGLGPHVEGSAHPDLARKGRGKRLDFVPFHEGTRLSGMQRRPLDDEKFQAKFPNTKQGRSVDIVPGQRSRTAGAGETSPLSPGYHATKANNERGLRNFNHHQLGRNVLNNSIVSGSTHIEKLK
jgi:hypothetical protein